MLVHIICNEGPNTEWTHPLTDSDNVGIQVSTLLHVAKEHPYQTSRHAEPPRDVMFPYRFILLGWCHIKFPKHQHPFKRMKNTLEIGGL